MDTPHRERELIHKLVTTWHLDGHERRALPGGTARASLIYGVITEALEAHGRFPVEWQPDDSFAAGVIERKADGAYRITWEADVSMLHYEAVSVQEFDSRQRAVETFARAFFGGDIDGIPIDWSA
jgi:hypothetical protein